jgi:hypothetical protein
MANGFPAYINVNELGPQLRAHALLVASKIKNGNIVLVTGGTGTNKEAFACQLALDIAQSRTGKRVFFTYATSIESPRVGEDESWGHIVIFSMADQIFAKYSRAVLSRVTNLAASGNIPIVLVRGIHTFTRVYGEDFVTAYSDLLKVVALPEQEKIELEAL